MSDKYVAGNDEGTMELFYKRHSYMDVSGQLASDNEKERNLIDFQLGEKYLYGRVNRAYIPILYNDANLPLKRLPSTPSNRSGFSAAPYVADAFNDLRLVFQEYSLGKKIRANHKYLSNLVPTRGYDNPRKLHYDHTLTLQDTLQQHYESSDINFRDFDEFLVHFKESVRLTARQFPFTLPAYVKSRRCPMGASGLVIEIADLNSANDEQKVAEFIDSPNWPFYVNACRTYGFSVDRNNPWRLVADIASTPMLEYAARYGYDNTEMILDVSYRPAPNAFYARFIGFLLGYYNKLKKKIFLDHIYCDNTQRTITQAVTPQTYDAAVLQATYGEEFFLKLYCEIRIMEEESKITPVEQERLIRQTIEIYRLAYAHQNQTQASAASSAVTRFETVLNKTYDYSGSLTELTNRVTIEKSQAE